MTLTLSDVTRLCKICTNQITASQIWNMIDREDEPEPLWAEMARVIPWAFENPSNANSIKFAYPPRKEMQEYEQTRSTAAKRIAKIQFALREMAAILKATSKCGEDAGYIELDIVCQSDELLRQVEQLLCNDRQWENMELAKSTVGV